MVEPGVIWWMELIGWVLIGLEYFVPRRILEAINAPLREHSIGVQKRIMEDVSAKTQFIKTKRQRLLWGVFCIIYALCMIAIGPVLAGLHVWIDFFAHISFVLAACLWIPLMWPIFELVGLLALASPFYSLFLFISKCPKGALIAYGVTFQIIAMVLKHP